MINSGDLLHMAHFCCVGAAATSAVDAVYCKLDPNPDAPPADVPLLAVARLSWASALLGDIDAASALAKRVCMGKHARARAWAGLTLAHLSLQPALPADSHGGATRMTRADVTRLCALLEELEQCIQDFLGAGDVHGLHACCKCAFAPLTFAAPCFEVGPCVLSSPARCAAQVAEVDSPAVCGPQSGSRCSGW